MHPLSFLSAHTSNSYDAGRITGVVMLSAFVLTFILARGYTRVARIRHWKSARISGIHTHHLVFGMVLAFFAAALEFTLLPSDLPTKLILATVFGGGAALVLDEFALTVHLQDVYWEKEGRKSVDAVIIATIFGIFLVFHTVPFGHAADLSGLLLTIYVLLNLIFVLGSALKGKLYIAVFGVFVPVIAILGAIRLADPESLWARQFYDPKGLKMRVAEKRYADVNRIWQPRKDFIWDFVGGKTGRPKQD